MRHPIAVPPCAISSAASSVSPLSAKQAAKTGGQALTMHLQHALLLAALAAQPAMTCTAQLGFNAGAPGLAARTRSARSPRQPPPLLCSLRASDVTEGKRRLLEVSTLRASVCGNVVLR